MEKTTVAIKVLTVESPITNFEALILLDAFDKCAIDFIGRPHFAVHFPPIRDFDFLDFDPNPRHESQI
ncbi:hypothetical protein M513_13952 [Trichuris suis]|uniref:Uncharacterized protein n=1 Tax=Trichuris suis TaxID=68888 RepID=A0A085LJM5_9BILA|nr:hypothetical protein M513_13952 [Trichuris suis]